MVQLKTERATRHHAQEIETHEDFISPENGQFSLAALQLLVGGKISSHYEGPPGFAEVINFGTEPAETLKGSKLAPEERWTKQSDIPEEYRDKLTVLSFTQPHIKALLGEVSILAGDFLSRPKTKTLAAQRRYTRNVDKVMGLAVKKFEANRRPNTAAVTLLRGGLRFEDDFPVSPDRQIRVDAKRLDLGETMMIGFSGWEGIESLQGEQAPESVELAFVDDCGATFCSIEAAVLALQARHMDGQFPRIDTVRIYITVAVQQGLESLFRNFKALGIDVEVVAGDIAYQLSDQYYIQRAEGELKPDGRPFHSGHPYVGDMGVNLLKRLQRKIAQMKKALL